MDKKYAEYLLRKTKDDYNLISEEFSRNREFLWEDLKPLSQYVQNGEKILDLGCGNGRLVELFKDKNVEYFGVDNSPKLIEIAKKRYPKVKFLVVDAFDLPFPENYFDKIFSIAVFHHIPSEKLRLQFLKETKRILKPDGHLILSVWNAWGARDKRNLFRIIQYGFLKIIGRSKLDFKDTFVPKEKKVLIYYHFFTLGELKSLMKKSDFQLKQSWVIIEKGQHSNIYLIAAK